MDIQDTLELVRAGFTADEIRAMSGAAAPKPEPRTAKATKAAAASKTGKRSKQTEKRRAVVIERVKVVSGEYSVLEHARALASESAFKGMTEGSRQQFIRRMIADEAIGLTPDGKLYYPKVPADASSLTEAAV